MNSLQPQWRLVEWDELATRSAQVSVAGLLTPEVHVWQARLDTEIAQLGVLAQWLSPDERDRADRFYFELHRRRFIMARGILRSLLGYYLTSPPEQIQFCYGPRGKPLLAVRPGDKMLYFNVSHSQDLSLYAIAQQSVGIDLEHLRPIDAESLARRCFLPREHRWLTNQPIEQRQDAFFRLWTAKEAVLKATGEGLAALGQVEIDTTHLDHGSIVRLDHPQSDWSEWKLQVFVPCVNYVAALATSACISGVAHFQLSLNSLQ